jgi:hypothetical protein
VTDAEPGDALGPKPTARLATLAADPVTRGIVTALLESQLPAPAQLRLRQAGALYRVRNEPAPMGGRP